MSNNTERQTREDCDVCREGAPATWLELAARLAEPGFKMCDQHWSALERFNTSPEFQALKAAVRTED